MWPLFALGVVSVTLFLYIPGFILLRSTRLSSFNQLLCAPVASLLLLIAISVALSIAGVACAWHVVVGLSFVIALLTFLLHSMLVRKRLGRAPHRALNSINKKQLMQLALYLAVSLCVGIYFYVRTLDSPMSIYQENDCFFHLNLIRQHVESQTYYSLSMGSYPQAWHCIAGLAADLLGGHVTIAANVVNFVFSIVIFPLGMLSFLCSIFPNDTRTVTCGSLVTLAFTAFPWGFFVFGPLYPNMAGYSMLPIAMQIFTHFLEWTPLGINRIKRLVGFIFACIALAALHPSAVFVGITILSPYCVYLIYHRTTTRNGNESSPAVHRQKAVMLSFVFVIFVLLIWTALFLAPALSGTVWFQWPAYLSVSQGVYNAFTLAYTKASAPQFFLAVCVFVGFIRSIYNPKYRWIAVGYCIILAMYLVNVTSDGTLKHYLTGFWYTDEFRVAAMAGMAAIPLAALGVDIIYETITKAIRSLQSDMNHLPPITPVLFGGLCLYLIFMPSHTVPMNGYVTTGFGQVGTMLTNGNNLNEDSNGYDLDEYNFVEKVKATVPDNAVVINFPYDGSIYSYGFNGATLYYEALYGFESQKSDSDEAIIRLHLNEISTNPAVQDAVRNSGGEYLLLLDTDSVDGKGLYTGPLDPNSWTGITSITDNTPGFEVVLSEGDMRLYRIVG